MHKTTQCYFPENSVANPHFLWWIIFLKNPTNIETTMYSKKLWSNMKDRVRKTTATQLGMMCILRFINKKTFVILFISIMSVFVAERSQDDWTKHNAWQEEERENSVKKEAILNYFAFFWVSFHISFAMRSFLRIIKYQTCKWNGQLQRRDKLSDMPSRALSLEHS